MTTNGIKYVTYKWLLTIILCSVAAILLTGGTVANALYFSKPDGASLQTCVKSMSEDLTEVRKDVKELLSISNHGVLEYGTIQPSRSG